MNLKPIRSLISRIEALEDAAPPPIPFKVRLLERWYGIALALGSSVQELEELLRRTREQGRPIELSSRLSARVFEQLESSSKSVFGMSYFDLLALSPKELDRLISRLCDERRRPAQLASQSHQERNQQLNAKKQRRRPVEERDQW